METIEQKTLPQVVINAADQYGDAIAIKQPHQQFTFAELNALRINACRAFIAAGVEKGDRVAIWAPNVTEWVVAAIGLQSAGAILVPINTRLKGSEAAFALNLSEAKLILTVNSFLGVNYPQLLADQDLPALEKIILLPDPEPHHPAGQLSDNVISWSTFLSAAEAISPDFAEQRAASILPTDIMDIMFTSGTTGQPKAVMCSHGQNIQCFTDWGYNKGIRNNDNVLLLSPFFHSFGYKAGWLAGLINGFTVFPVLSFDLDKVLGQIDRDKITVLDGTPTVFQSILAHPERKNYDLSSLRLSGIGGAPVSAALVAKMKTELGLEQVTTGYGLTETCGYVTGSRQHENPERVSNSSGCPIPGVEVKCIGLDGIEVPIGEAGEICVRGYNVMQGYYKNPEATAEVIDVDGWLHTGDIGILDQQGYLKITGRIKDMIISGGFNVYPVEIENSLANIEGVVQAAVVGIADERMGEVPKAYIVKAVDSDLQEQQVIDWCSTNMANYKVPRAVEFIDAMPLNASGKILKRELRQRF